jgi:hypothetical protein
MNQSEVNGVPLKSTGLACSISENMGTVFFLLLLDKSVGNYY